MDRFGGSFWSDEFLGEIKELKNCNLPRSPAQGTPGSRCWRAMESRSSGVRRVLRSACLKSRTRRAGSSRASWAGFMGWWF